VGRLCTGWEGYVQGGKAACCRYVQGLGNWLPWIGWFLSEGISVSMYKGWCRAMGPPPPPLLFGLAAKWAGYISFLFGFFFNVAAIFIFFIFFCFLLSPILFLILNTCDC